MVTKTLFVLFAVILIQAACSISTLAPQNATQARSTILPTETSIQITNTVLAVPTETSPTAIAAPSAVPPTASLVPVATGETTDANTVKIFLVAINDNGVKGAKIGCGDSLVPVSVPVTPTLGVLRAALTKLLSIKTRFFGGESDLYNSLYQSNLAIDSLNIQNSVAEIRLSGTISLGGVCDTPRFQAQLVQTALQFSTIKQVNIFINDKPLSEVLSSK